MTMEELLKPRVKCIANDTSGNFEVGETFYAESDGYFYMYGDEGRWRFHPEKFPYLFKKLEWWEERELSDMPEYVKADDGQVYKIKEWDGSGVPYIFVDTKIHTGYINECTYTVLYSPHYPATETEFLHFKNKT